MTRHIYADLMLAIVFKKNKKKKKDEENKNRKNKSFICFTISPASYLDRTNRTLESAMARS